MKKALKNLLSVVLCVAVALSCLFVVSGADIKASAYYGSNYITVGETHNFVLGNEVIGIANFHPQTSGFYKFTLTDNVRSGWIGMQIHERDNFIGIYRYNFYNYYPKQIINNYISSPIYMRAGNEYQINVIYYAQSYHDTMTGGNMSIKFEMVNYTPPLIPSSAASSNQAIYDASQGDQYFRYTTSQAGDYTLSYQSLKASVDVYRADDGSTVVSGRDAMFLTGGENSEYVSGNKMVFKLEANTTYYFRINRYSDYGSSPLYMNKTEKDVSHILAHSADRPISCLSGDSAIGYELNYKITYTDGSYDYMHYNDLNAAGYVLPEVTYGGEFVEFDDYLYILESGRAPIHSQYDSDHFNTIYVEVGSLADELIAEGETAIDELSVAYLKNYGDTNSNFLGLQRIKVFETGVYYIWPQEDTEWMELDLLEPIILDSDNNIVTYDEESESWGLVGGEEYVLLCKYSFYLNSYEDFAYGLESDRKTVFPDTASSQWYSDPIMYAYSTGIMKGYANGMFGTSDGIQRQDFLLMLARYSNVSPYSYAYSNLGGFTDLDSYAQYAYAVNWGYEKGIVTGYENGKFGVGDKITREQLVTFLYRYANYKGLDMTVTAKGEAKAKAYPDFALVSDFAEDAVIWAIDRGIINGKSGKIEPQGTAQRCEIAQIMYNIHTKNIF